ncbi:MAG: iron-containing redox enzyme family protein [Candidatus Korobacteraceae bacterium]
MSEQSTFWQEASGVLSQFDLLKHPFYQAWTCGELSNEDLRLYASQYYHQVAAFPTYLTALHSRLPDGRLRRQVLANAADEELRGTDHSSLWLQFAEAAGANADDVRASAPAPDIAEVVGQFRELASDAAPVKALAAFWAYESQVPRIAKEKAAGLRNRYGMGDSACAYFDLHAVVDEHHSKVWADEIDTLLAEGASSSDALEGIQTAASELWKALDYVEAARLQQRQQAAIQ